MGRGGTGRGSRAEVDVRRASALPLVAMTLLSLVDAVDSAVARGLLPVLAEEWDLSDLQLGLIPTVFVFLGIVATVPAGYLSDRVRRTRLMGWTVLSWSVLTVLSAAAVNFAHLLVARAAMGVGQAVDDPASTAYLADVYPSKVRGRVYSVQQVALFAGGGIGLALGGVLGETLGWRWTFALVALPGLALAPLLFGLREPQRAQLNQPEPPGVGDGDIVAFLAANTRTLWLELRAIFRIPTMRYLLVGLAAIYFTLSGVSTWLAIYHERYSGMSVGAATAATGAVLVLGGVVGTLGGGAFSDRFHHRWRGGRIVIVVWSGIAFSVLVLTSFVVGSVAVSVVLQLVGVALVAGAGPGLRAAMVDVVPASSRGVGASALGLTTALFGTAAAPVVVGALSDVTGSLVVAFYVAFVPAIAGFAVLSKARLVLDDDVAALADELG